MKDLKKLETLDEVMSFAKAISNSALVPQAFRGKPADIMVAITWGKELGLHPVQCLQNIAVINGKPSVYGDSLLALCRQHKDFEDIKEYLTGEGDKKAAVCEIKRLGQSWYKSTFTVEQAKSARLWNKVGPWTQYPDRMLKMRARGFALRDVFADKLGGVISAEEARDFPVEIPQSPAKKLEQMKPINATPVDATIDVQKKEIVKTNPSMAQEKPVLEEGNIQWEYRRLKGPPIMCQNLGDFVAELEKGMMSIRTHRKSTNKEKIKYLNNLVDLNDPCLAKLKKENLEKFSKLHGNQAAHISILKSNA